MPQHLYDEKEVENDGKEVDDEERGGGWKGGG